MTTGADEGRGAALVRNESLRRGLAVMRALALADGPVGPAELARTCAIPAPTVSRLLATLADEGMAVRVAGGWTAGPAVLDLAGAAGRLARVVAAAGPVLRGIADRVGESAVLARVRPPHVVEVVAQEDADRLVGATRWAGRAFDARRSVAGWAAAALAPPAPGDPAEVVEARARGYGLDVDGVERGLTSIALAVGALEDGSALTIGVGAPSARLDEADARALVPLLEEGAAALRSFI